MLRSVSARRLARSHQASVSHAEIWAFVTRSFGHNAKRPTPHRARRCLGTSTSCRESRETWAVSSDNTHANYKRALSFPPATHAIRDLDNASLAGEEVVLHGYLGNRSDLSKGLFFLPLISADLHHTIQIISTAKSQDGSSEPLAHDELKRHAANTPVVVKGKLKSRKPAPTSKLGDYVRIQVLEVAVGEVWILNTMPKDIVVAPGTVFSPEQRHLEMRQQKSLRDTLAFRSRAARVCRASLEDDFGFVEVETPILFKSTPEGAREFVVPTRRKGLAYALPQSPQQFKQVLIAGGFHRYYQLARCFRDEDRRADRQPEFTQLDLEMSFAGGEDVMQIITRVVRSLWKGLLQIELPEQFQQMKYAEAMAKYGVDKPDVRYGMQLTRVDHLLPAGLVSKISPLTLPAVDAMIMSMDTPCRPTETKQFVAAILDSMEGKAFQQNPDGGPGIFIFDSSKPLSGLQALGFEAAEKFERMFELKDGDLIILQARKDVPFSGGSTHIGNLRVLLHSEALRQELLHPPEGFAPLWITDFPLFTPASTSEPGQGGKAGLASTHHPFTSPKTAEDVDLLLTNPTEVIGEHYDLVINGVELGGGSRRIHNAGMQRLIMEQVLQMTPERVSEFSHLLEALRAGCPPHAGIALGFDRLIAMMLGKSSVRDVIAFPKNGSGEDMLMKSPGSITDKQLETYHLRLCS